MALNPRNSVWEHFERIETERDGKRCFLARCKLCQGAAGTKFDAQREYIDGRPRNLRAHLRICPPYLALVDSTMNGSTGGSAMAMTTLSPQRHRQHQHHPAQQQPQHQQQQQHATFHQDQIRASPSASPSPSPSPPPSLGHLHSNAATNQENKRRSSPQQNVHRQPLKKIKSAVEPLRGQRLATRAPTPAPLPAAQTQQLLKCLVNAVVAQSLPLSFVEHPTTAALIECLQPQAVAVLPTQQTLHESLFRSIATDGRSAAVRRLAQLQADGCSLNLVLDHWVDASKQQYLGCELKSGDECVAFDEALESLGNKAPEKVDSAARTAQAVEQALLRAQELLGERITAVCLVDTGKAVQAKRILDLRFPSVHFGKCFAHLLNVVAKDVMTIPKFRDTRARVQAFAQQYTSAPWRGRLHELCREVYGDPFACTFVECGGSRWSAMHTSAATIVRIRTALELAPMRFKDLPEEFVIDRSFVRGVANLEQYLRPLAEMALALQRPSSSLADVLSMFGKLFHAFADLDDKRLVQKMELLWRKQEQPLLLLAFMLHPEYAQAFRDIANKPKELSRASVIEYALYYYKKFFDDDWVQLAAEVSDWLNDAHQSSVALFKDMGPIKFWSTMQRDIPSLARLACRVLSLPVQSAACERVVRGLGAFPPESRSAHYLTLRRKLMNEMDAKQRPLCLLAALELPFLALERNGNSVISLDELERNLESANNATMDDVDVMELVTRLEDENETDVAASEWRKTSDEVMAMRFDDGTAFRAAHPLVDSDGADAPQYQPSGLRATKIELRDLFGDPPPLPKFSGIEYEQMEPPTAGVVLDV